MVITRPCVSFSLSLSEFVKGAVRSERRGYVCNIISPSPSSLNRQWHAPEARPRVAVLDSSKQLLVICPQTSTESSRHMLQVAPLRRELIGSLRLGPIRFSAPRKKGRRRPITRYASANNKGTTMRVGWFGGETGTPRNESPACNFQRRLMETNQHGPKFLLNFVALNSVPIHSNLIASIGVA
jgi:hypothetical protein